MTTFLQKIKKVRRTGLWNVLIGQIKKGCLYMLYVVYRFDRWHAMRPYETTNYKKITVTLAQRLEPYRVVDVGCGLGDILRHIDAPSRIGIDIDVQALRCARMLNFNTKNPITYKEGSILAVAELQQPVDVLIMTGWIHVKTDEWVKPLLSQLFAQSKIKYCIVDEFPYQKGRIEPLFSPYGEVVEVTEDWQDGKTIFTFKIRE